MSSQTDNYWPEPCAYCGGGGKLPALVREFVQRSGFSIEQLANKEETPSCVVCKGKAYVLVLQPSRKCGRCDGTGIRFQVRCLYCQGTGWMFVQKEAAKPEDERLR